MRVYVACITGENGTFVFVHLTAEEAYESLYEYVSFHWDVLQDRGIQVGEIPANQEAAVDRYFDTSKETYVNEYYEIHQHEVQP